MFIPFLRRRSASSAHSLSRGRTIRARHFRPLLESLEDRMLPSTFLVTNFNDSGPGSLRAAITAVNKDTTSTTDEIDFHLAGKAPWTINLKSELPVIKH